jgi:hypothetical protein
MPVAAAIAALPEAQRAIAEPLAALLLGVGGVVAAIKWNSPSFQEVRSGLFFATFQFPVKKGQPTGVGLRLVLHRDAKKPVPGGRAPASPPIAATLGELLGADRALIPLADAADFAAKEQEIAAYVRAWLGVSA